MVAMTMPMNFFTPRRKTKTGPRLSKTEVHLKAYLDMHDDMTPAERRDAAALAWMPPRPVIEILLDPALRQRDRVEIVIVAFSTTHPGHTPSWDVVGRVLGIAAEVARTYSRTLIKEGRAEMRDGKFCLKPAGYSHPIVRARFPDIYRLP